MAYTALHQHNLALETIDKGLKLSFDLKNEHERREQIRLLSTKALSLHASGDCVEAENVWGLRNSLKRQQLSKCTSLISAQINSCGGRTDKREEVLRNVLIGIGQSPGTFKDRTEVALMALVEQAQKTFTECYVWLTFDDIPVKTVMKDISSANN